MSTQHQKNQLKHLHELRRFARARVRILRKEYMEVARVGKLGAYSSDSDFDDWKARRALRDYIQHRYDLARADLENVDAAYQALRYAQHSVEICHSVTQSAPAESFPGPFTWAAHVSGDYNCTFHFKQQKDLATWLTAGFLKLQEKYGELKVSQETLPGLKVGDSCHVWGDGSDEYKIVDFKKWAPNCYGFVLDSGFIEPAHKCY